MDKRGCNKRGIDSIPKLVIMIISLLIYCLLVYSCSADMDMIDQYGKRGTNTNKTNSGKSSGKSSGVNSVPSPQFDVEGGTYLSRVELHISLKGLSDGTIIHTTDGLDSEFSEGCVVRVGFVYRDVKLLEIL